MTYAIRDTEWLEERREFLQQVGVCIASGQSGPIEVAHIRYSDHVFGKDDAGMGLKSGHQWTVPLSTEMHRRQHEIGEKVFWIRHGWDPTSATHSPLVAAAVITQFQATWNIDGARAWMRERWREAMLVRA